MIRAISTSLWNLVKPSSVRLVLQAVKQTEYDLLNEAVGPVSRVLNLSTNRVELGKVLQESVLDVVVELVVLHLHGDEDTPRTLLATTARTLDELRGEQVLVWQTSLVLTIHQAKPSSVLLRPADVGWAAHWEANASLARHRIDTTRNGVHARVARSVRLDAVTTLAVEVFVEPAIVVAVSIAIAAISVVTLLAVATVVPGLVNVPIWQVARRALTLSVHKRERCVQVRSVRTKLLLHVQWHLVLEMRSHRKSHGRSHGMSPW